jgi:predicted RNase H-like HicB family nuclease
MQKRTVRVDVHREPGGHWAHIPEWDGCFARGATLDELLISLQDSLSLYLGEGDESEHLLVRVTGLELEVESDLRPPGMDSTTESPAHRKRRSHREDDSPRDGRPPRRGRP